MVNAVGSCQAGRLQRSTPHSAPSQVRLPASAARRARSASTLCSTSSSASPATSTQCQRGVGSARGREVPRKLGASPATACAAGTARTGSITVASSRMTVSSSCRVSAIGGSAASTGSPDFAAGMSCADGSGVRASVAGAASPSDAGRRKVAKGRRGGFGSDMLRARARIQRSFNHDQARRVPVMRIQSPSWVACRSSNHAA